MTRFALIGVISAVLLIPCIASATIFGSVRGVVHDPQHRPIQGAHVTLKAQNSDWTSPRTQLTAEDSSSLRCPSEVIRSRSRRRASSICNKM